MKYSSKQKLAMAMAATMVVAVVPQMAFAAPRDLDAVIKKLGEEDRSLAQAKDPSSAKKVAGEAAALVNGDARAQLVLDAYNASIAVFEATNQADWTAKKKAFDDAVAKLTFLDVSGSFKHAQTDANHKAVFDGFGTPQVSEFIDYTFKANAALPAFSDFTITKIKDAKVKKYQILSGGTPEMAITDAAENTPISIMVVEGKEVEIVLFEADGTTEVGRFKTTIKY